MRMVHTAWAETAIEAMRATKGRREVIFMMVVFFVEEFTLADF